MRVAIRNASKKFGGRDQHQALSGVSLTAEDGEFLVLLGPSGSGKTTLLRSIAGLEEVDSGDILFGETRVNDFDPGSRRIGMVFQDYALYPHLTVRKNIAYNMKVRRLDRAEVERRVKDVAAMLGIDRLLDRRPSELSGGQRQRVALARAITRDASVLLMDEPLSNLDAQIREHVRVELRELQRRLRVTTIYVTHDQVEAMVMADRIAVMNEGRIEQISTPDQVYGAPTTIFCARFVGSPKINELGGSLVPTGAGRAEFRVDGGHAGDSRVLSLSLSEPEHVEAEERCILAFRSEDTEIVRAAGGAVGMAASVSLVENRGAEKYLVANMAAPLRSAQMSADLRLRLLGEPVPEAGREIGFVPTRVHVFSAESGKRIAAGNVLGAQPPRSAVTAG